MQKTWEARRCLRVAGGHFPGAAPLQGPVPTPASPDGRPEAAAPQRSQSPRTCCLGNLSAGEPEQKGRRPSSRPSSSRLPPPPAARCSIELGAPGEQKLALPAGFRFCSWWGDGPWERVAPSLPGQSCWGCCRQPWFAMGCGHCPRDICVLPATKRSLRPHAEGPRRRQGPGSQQRSPDGRPGGGQPARRLRPSTRPRPWHRKRARKAEGPDRGLRVASDLILSPAPAQGTLGIRRALVVLRESRVLVPRALSPAGAGSDLAGARWGWPRGPCTAGTRVL